jgi:hypothetical protein
MEIHMLIIDGRKVKNKYVPPTKLHFKGNFALEQCILKLVEAYFGPKLKDTVEDLLKARITDDEIPDELLMDELIIPDDLESKIKKVL